MALNPLVLQPVNADVYGIERAAQTIMQGYMIGQQRKAARNQELVTLLQTQIQQNNIAAAKQLEDPTLTYEQRDKLKADTATANAQLMKQLMLAANNGKPLKNKDPRLQVFQAMIDNLAAQGQPTSQGKGVSSSGDIVSNATVISPTGFDPLQVPEGTLLKDNTTVARRSLGNTSPAEIAQLRDKEEQRQALERIQKQVETAGKERRDTMMDTQAARQGGTWYSPSTKQFYTKVYTGRDANGAYNYDVLDQRDQVVAAPEDLVPLAYQQATMKQQSALLAPIEKAAIGHALFMGWIKSPTDWTSLDAQAKENAYQQSQKLSNDERQARINFYNQRSETEEMRQAGTLPPSQTSQDSSERQERREEMDVVNQYGDATSNLRTAITALSTITSNIQAAEDRIKAAFTKRGATIAQGVSPIDSAKQLAAQGDPEMDNLVKDYDFYYKQKDTAQTKVNDALNTAKQKLEAAKQFGYEPEGEETFGQEKLPKTLKRKIATTREEVNQEVQKAAQQSSNGDEYTDDVLWYNIDKFKLPTTTDKNDKSAVTLAQIREAAQTWATKNKKTLGEGLSAMFQMIRNKGLKIIR